MTGEMDASQERDAELIRRIAEGDKRAFEALFSAYGKRIFRYASRMIGDVSRAEEVTNDVMIEVWKSAGRFEARSRPSTWIIGITRHLCLNAMRGKRYDMVDIDDTPVASNDTPEAARSQEDDQRLLRQAVAKLSPEHREVVELTFYQGLSYKEIAEIAGCPENTVKTRMFHAKKQLKARLTRLAQGSALGIGGTA